MFKRIRVLWLRYLERREFIKIRTTMYASAHDCEKAYSHYVELRERRIEAERTLES